jgi:hypothetical protein
VREARHPFRHPQAAGGLACHDAALAQGIAAGIEGPVDAVRPRPQAFELVVRGVCCLQPGVAGRSENIRVRTFLGRFLEHSRLFRFENSGGEPVILMGSADWMPRNLMVTTPNPGILDFQDAVAGPVTYDMASLLRDAFLSWEEERELDWAVRYWQAARQGGVPLGETMGQDFGEFWRALEWMGLQRHLKVLGIFCRLKHRDGKPAYAQDLPRFFAYAAKVAMRYRELKPLIRLLEPLAGPLTVEAYSLR